MSINPIFTVIRKPFNMEATIFDHSFFYLYATFYIIDLFQFSTAMQFPLFARGSIFYFT